MVLCRAVRLGCGGCSSAVLALVALGVVAAAGGWALTRALQPPGADAPRFTREDGVRAQQKILDLARQRVKSGSVVFSEAEINAFVSRHLEPDQLPLRDPVIRLRDGDVVEIVGTIPLGNLLRDSPLAPRAERFPAEWLARPVWLTVVARAEIATEPRHMLRLVPRRLEIGDQRVPAFVLRLVLDPSSLRLTRIALPPHVQTVRIERGRAIIQMASPPSRT